MVYARVEVDVDAGALILGEVGPFGHHGADVLVGVLGEECDQVRVHVRVSGEGAALGRRTVACQVFGEVACQAAGLRGTVLDDVIGVEDRPVHRVVLVVWEKCLCADLAVRIIQEVAPGRGPQVGPSPRAGRGAHSRVRVGGQGGQ